MSSERTKEDKQVKKSCKFKPATKKSERSYAGVVKGTQQLMRKADVTNPYSKVQPVELAVKGLNTHMSRIMKAKQKKIEE